MFADRYELRGVLGEGGMGIVYEAIAHGARGFTRRVAVKQLGTGASDDPVLERLFLDEARIASRLHHAGIVAVLDYGIVDGAPFQVLELVEGVDAGALLRRARARGARIPLEIALHIAAEVAHALAYAHAAKADDGSPLGIVHRDVKPSNIFVSWSGYVKLGDFGIALARDRVSTKTTGFGRGTPTYMPPEQVFGQPVDARVDVFALGCTLHTLVTGESPLRDEDSRQAFLVGDELAISGVLPEDVRAIITRATRRDARDRFPTALEMASALGAALVARLTTDPKSRLLAWLDEMSVQRAPQAAPPAPTVLVAHGAGETRAFQKLDTVAQVPRTRRERPPLAGPSGAPRASKRRVFLYALGATVLLGATGAALASRLRGERLADAIDAGEPDAGVFATASAAPTETEQAAPAAADGATVPTTPAGDAVDAEAPQRPPPRVPRLRRVEIAGVYESRFGPSAPALKRSLEQRTLACFRNEPRRPGLFVEVQFVLELDGSVTDLVTRGGCDASRVECKGSAAPSQAAIDCVRNIVETSGPFHHGGDNKKGVDIDASPIWE